MNCAGRRFDDITATCTQVTDILRRRIGVDSGEQERSSKGVQHVTGCLWMGPTWESKKFNNVPEDSQQKELCSLLGSVQIGMQKE